MDDCHSERRKGVLLLDEVDMLLHPLRSELNFPIGVKRSIGPAPHRWDLAWSILDAIFCAAEIALSSNVPAIDEDDEDDDGDFAVEEREDVHAGEGVNGRGARHADEHDDDGFEVEGREGIHVGEGILGSGTRRGDDWDVVEGGSVEELKSLIEKAGLRWSDCIETPEFRRRARQAFVKLRTSPETNDSSGGDSGNDGDGDRRSGADGLTTTSLSSIATALRDGLSNMRLARTPHLILLDPSFYDRRLREPLVGVVLSYLKAHHVFGDGAAAALSDSAASEYILRGPEGSTSATLSAMRRLEQMTGGPDKPPPPPAAGSAAEVPKRVALERIVEESAHPYTGNSSFAKTILVPGATRVAVSFDYRSKTESNYDVLSLNFPDGVVRGLSGKQFESFKHEFEGDRFELNWKSDGFNEDWGWKMHIDGSVEAEPELSSTNPVQVLNLAHELLTSIVPHLLGKVDHVTFGLIQPRDEEVLPADPPLSRMLLAVPFVGKDVPSAAAEFSQPDVLIGATILAYRYEGLRQTDVKRILRQLKRDFNQEQGAKAGRPAAKLFEGWVEAAVERRAAVESRPPTREVLQLEMFQLGDPGQIAAVHGLLRNDPSVIRYYLRTHVFPETMKAQQTKISASGQELGAPVLFGRRLGFSGTPSNLIPRQTLPCAFEHGSEGQILRALTDERVTSNSRLSAKAAKLPKAWNVRWVLDEIAGAVPPYHVLIDAGALITGFSNEDVARYLVDHGLPSMEGCVFLDHTDKKLVYVRGSTSCVPLAECGLSEANRFTFYDQVHTTGTDIKQALGAVALITLGKVSTTHKHVVTLGGVLSVLNAAKRNSCAPWGVGGNRCVARAGHDVPRLRTRLLSYERNRQGADDRTANRA